MARIRISRHWSIEPEFNYMRRSSNDQDYVVQPNVVYEFNALEDRVVPYLIGGVGDFLNPAAAGVSLGRKPQVYA